MHIVVVGLSHRTAPVEVREKLSIPDQSITDSLKALKAFSNVLEVSILSTSNRLEIYALVKDKILEFHLLRNLYPNILESFLKI